MLQFNVSVDVAVKTLPLHLLQWKQFECCSDFGIYAQQFQCVAVRLHLTNIYAF